MASLRFLFVLFYFVFLPAVALAQAQTDDRFLLPGQTIEREMKGSEAHFYKIRLEQNVFLQIHVEQKGIDLLLKLKSSNNEVLATMDSPNGTMGPEILEFISSISGDYTLEITSLDEKAPAGKYSVRLIPPRPAVERDRKKIEADKIFREATDLTRVQTEASLKEAGAKFEQAYKLYKEIGSKNEAAFSLINGGNIAKAFAQKPKAIALYKEAALLYEEAGNKAGLATAFNNLGNTYVASNKDEALKYFNLAVSNAQDKITKAAILGGMAEIFSTSGDNEKAISYLNQALTLTEEEGFLPGQIAILNGLANYYVRVGDSEKAMSYFNRAMPLVEKVGDLSLEAVIITGMGQISASQGKTQEALRIYNNALQKLRAIGDVPGYEGKLLISIGKIYDSLGEYSVAMNYYNDALSKLQKAEDKDGIATVLNNIGSVQKNLGNMQAALENYDQAKDLFEKTGYRKGESMALSNIGALYNALGENAKAEDILNAALKIQKSINDKEGYLATLHNLSTVYTESGKTKMALDVLLEASLALKATEGSIAKAMVNHNLGAIYAKLHDFPKAFDYYQQALDFFRSSGNRYSEALTLSGLGDAYSSTGDNRKALDLYYEALPLFKAVKNKKGEAIALHNSMVLWSKNNRNFSIFFGKQSVNALQQVRNKNRSFNDAQIQISFLKSVDFSYRGLADLLLDSGRLVEAHQTLNSLKDQEYFDSNPTEKKQLLPLAFTPLENKFDALYKEKGDLAGVAGGELEDLKRKIGSRQPTVVEAADLRRLEGRFKTASAEFLGILKKAETELAKAPDGQADAAEIPDTKEMQATLRDLQLQTKKKVIAIYTLAGQKNFWALIVLPNELVCIPSPAGKAVNQKAVEFLEKISSFNYETHAPRFSDAETQKVGKELFDTVYSRIGAKLKMLNVNPEVIMWSLDGPLRYIPINALYDGERYLAQNFTNVVFTRASARRLLAAGSLKWTGSGFYSSKAHVLTIDKKMVNFRGLANAKPELESIFGVPPSKGVIAGDYKFDENFTKESLLLSLKLKRPLVHIASHFKFEAGDSNSSFLLLGDGSKMTLTDIKDEPEDIFSGVELLTLSACETGVQKERELDGREIDGFAELAQRRGAGAVLASLWSVNDESTSQLMTQFYRQHETKRLTKAEALQNAQLALLKNKKYSHPFYWAPFFLVGNWR